MRIRKRFLCLSAAITAPRSPNLLAGNHNHRQPPVPPVQHQELHPNGNQHAGHDNTRLQFSDHPNQCHRPLSPCSTDHATQIGLQPSTWVSSGDCNDQNNTEIFKKLESEMKIESIKGDDTGCGKESILCTEANIHDLVLKGWLQGDTLVPVKKKRGSHGKRLINDGAQDFETTEGSILKPKPKKNDNKLVTMCSKNTKNMKNEKRSEGAILEGSRCSRVNGRGWRCSQQTLVGYSLCEHHLGKGRLRSMTNVRGSSQGHALALKQQHIDDDDDNEDDDDDIKYHEDDDEEFKHWGVSSMEGSKVFSKKTKIGVVKARSLSSLLSQIGS
ncbi:hypothetical protein R6Q59_025748 [Mikania micrantha]|uniref:WRC domain-containing protein n=1 Tax=Mikania micrantha TaxID=192012 RepID=A0A5N6PC63_9ASTR|nr:hypothetical protein E3N88_11012 [Mikania micrantha]